MEDESDNASFLDGLISPDTRRRTREQTQPLVELICSPLCIRSTIVTVGSALLILATLLIAISLTAELNRDYDGNVESQRAPLWMLDHIKDNIVRIHLKTLSSDVMEGRAPGTRGEAIATEYIASHFAIAGLQPVNGSYYQTVPLASVDCISPPPLVLGPITLSYPDQYTVSSDFFTSEVAVINTEMVFVGYGIEAPLYNWSDYKGFEVKDKIVVMLVNEPFDNATLFAGSTLTYYGRWTYKFEQARAKGALGVMLIHTTQLAGYGWQVVANSFAGEQVMLTDPPITNPLHYKGWINEQAADALARYHDSSLAEWMLLANSTGFTPIPLSTRFSLSVNYTVRHFNGTNVVGRLGDPDASEGETVIMMAHHDHLGIRPAIGSSSNDTDDIYNGAVDNASGVAALLTAAYALGSLYQKPNVVTPDLPAPQLRRSILFVTFTGEESNLLGSTYFTIHPPCDTSIYGPACGAVAALNFDIANVWGPTRDVVAIGQGMSGLLDIVLAQATDDEDIVLVPDPTPHLGHLFRSDQLPFALENIPSLTLSAGTHYLGRPSNYYQTVTQAYVAEHYHQPSDEYDPSWSMDGVIQQTRLMTRIAYQLSTEEQVPRIENSEILPPPITASRR